MWVELAPVDAAKFGISEGDVVRVGSPRGAVVARARLSGVRPGVVFVPFHYGSWGGGGHENGHERAANELTLLALGSGIEATAAEIGRRAGHQDRGLGRRSCAGTHDHSLRTRASGPRGREAKPMTKIARAFDDIHDAESRLADTLRALAERHAPDVDVYHVAHLLASRCAHQVELLVPHAERYEADAPRN